MKLHIVDIIALVLLVIGGLNWGLVGIARINVVSTIFGSLELLARIVYTLVGIAGIYAIVRFPTLAHVETHAPTHA
jgi:uncharacterized membrane protein YuzA (DUF378 family)